MARLRVLVVDDNREFLISVERLLGEDPRVEVVGRARSGREALEAIDSLRPDLVLMDLAMPEISGLEATNRVKRQPNPPYVVIMTCHNSKEYQAAARIV